MDHDCNFLIIENASRHVELLKCLIDVVGSLNMTVQFGSLWWPLTFLIYLFIIFMSSIMTAADMSGGPESQLR